MAVRAEAATVIESGEFGNVTWTLMLEGVLTISGTGDTAALETSGAPWRKYYDDVKGICRAAYRRKRQQIPGNSNFAGIDSEI